MRERGRSRYCILSISMQERPYSIAPIEYVIKTTTQVAKP